MRALDMLHHCSSVKLFHILDSCCESKATKCTNFYEKKKVETQRFVFRTSFPLSGTAVIPLPYKICWWSQWWKERERETLASLLKGVWNREMRNEQMSTKMRCNLIKIFLFSNGTFYFICLQEGTFVWGDGTLDDGLIPWHIWSEVSSEPDSHLDREHCVALFDKILWTTPIKNLPTYSAFDVSCDASFSYVCEKSGNRS